MTPRKSKKLKTGAAKTPSTDPRGVSTVLRANVKVARNLLSDFTVVNEGTIFLLIPNTPAAEAWCDERLPEDRMTFGRGVVVEHRYIANVVEGIQRDGLGVKG
jgi:hypothetical protein